MSFEAYKIAVSINLVEHVSAGLANLSRHFQRTDMDAKALQQRLDSIGKMSLAGGLLAGAGALGLKAISSTITEAKKLAQAQADFHTLNLSSSENAEAFAKAAANSHKVLGTTITENVKQIHDLHTAFGDLHHAISTSEDFAKLSFVAKVANHGKPVDGLINAAAKALEHRGGKVINDEGAFKTELEMMSQVMLGSKMRVSPADYLAASKTGKMAYQMYDKEYLYGNYAGQMQINGGDRMGTQGMTAFSSLVGGHMDKKAKGFLSELDLYQEGFSKKRLAIMNSSLAGLSPEERKTAIASMGGEAVIAGGLKDGLAEKFTHRPDLFVKEVLAPAIRKRFGMDLSNERVAAIIASNFNRNTGDFLGTQVTMGSKLEKDTAIFGKSMNFRAGYAHYLKSPEGAKQAAEAAMTNFKTVFGMVFLPSFTAGLLKLAKVIDTVVQAMERHPTITKVAGYMAAIISTAALLGGGLLLLKAAFSGLGLVMGAGGVLSAGAVGAVTTAVVGLGAAFAALAAGFAVGSVLNKGIDALLSKVRGKETSLGSSLYDWVHSGSGNTTPGGGGFASNGGGAAFGSPHIRGGGNKTVQVTTTTNINGRAIAKTVSTHQAAELSRPATGGRSFDGSMQPQGSW